MLVVFTLGVRSIRGSSRSSRIRRSFWSCRSDRRLRTHRLRHRNRWQIRNRTLLARQPLRPRRDLLDVLKYLGNLVVIKRFLLQQLKRQPVKNIAVHRQNLVRFIVRLLKNLTHLGINLLRNTLGEVPGGAELTQVR